MSNNGLDCEVPLGHQPDPDIAGIGVITGFLGTAWLVVFILVVYYLVFFDPTLDPFSEDPSRKLERPNPIDMVFYNAKLTLFRSLAAVGNKNRNLNRFRRKFRSRVGREIFIDVVMALSDTQIVSGIAILVSGYYSATRGMSGYHWKMMIRIAWFSTITHLAALSCLRSYLYQNPVKRALRLFLIGCLAVMLIVATLATADIDFKDDLPAGCFIKFSRSSTRLKNPDVILPILLLSYNISLRAVKLHRKASEGWPLRIKQGFLKWTLVPLIKLTATGLPSTDRFSLEELNASRLTAMFRFSTLIPALVILSLRPMVATLIIAKTYYLLYTSTVAEVYWVLVSVFWGTLRLFDLRKSQSQGEDNWTFGQVVPCAMFLAPILALLDTTAKTMKEVKSLAPARPSDYHLDDGGPRLNRYPQELANPATCAPWLNDYDGVPTSSLAKTDLLNRLETLESRWFSVLSAQPLVSYAHSADPSPQQPFLGYFEDLPFFPYLTIHLCSWVLFITFWTLFSWFPLFDPIAKHFHIKYHTISSLPFGRFSEHSPALALYYALPWVLLLAPMSSILYIMCYPRRAILKIGCWKPLRVFLKLSYSMAFILSSILTFLYLGLDRLLLVMSTYYFIVAIALILASYLPFWISRTRYRH